MPFSRPENRHPADRVLVRGLDGDHIYAACHVSIDARLQPVTVWRSANAEAPLVTGVCAAFCSFRTTG